MIEQGYVQIHQQYITKSSFFIIEIQEDFQHVPYWYRKGTVRGLVLHYYFVLRSILRSKSHLRKLLTRCRDCGIFFITHPQNVKRDDLRCPFGCSQAHREEDSKKRSAEWYRSEKGKEKKKALNRRRSIQSLSSNGSKYLANKESSPRQGHIVQDDSQVVSDRVTLSYIQMLISVIEGRFVSLDEVLTLLRKKVRQRSIDKQKQFIYAIHYPRGKPKR